jgi:hypothetical protein
LNKPSGVYIGGITDCLFLILSALLFLLLSFAPLLHSSNAFILWKEVGPLIVHSSVAFMLAVARHNK